MPRPGRLRGLGIALGLILALSLAEAQVPDSLRFRYEPRKSSTGAVLRSLAFPGWGQFYTESYTKSAVFFLGEVAFGASISWNNDRMLASRKAAENAVRDMRTIRATLPSDSARAVKLAVLARREADNRSNEYFFLNQRNRLVWWLAGVVLLSMGDAYVDAQLYHIDVSPDISFLEGRVGFTLSCKF